MRVEVLGVKIDRESMAETIRKIQEAIANEQRIQVITANPELIYAAVKDARLNQLINSAQIVTPDGVGVVWAAKKLGNPVAERVTGIDLLEALFPVAVEKGWRIFFLGSGPGVADLAARKVDQRYPGLIWKAEHGYFEREEEIQVVKKIEDFKPDILLVGLGSPRQEFWIFSHLNCATVIIGVGGSFDALAELNKRAPLWIRNIRLEWLYRLIKQPKRLRRQLVLPRFAWAVLQSSKKQVKSRKAR